MTIKVIPPFETIGSDLIYEYLLERDFQPVFSWKRRLYYDLLRPVMPQRIRRLLQRMLNGRKPYRQYFIDDSLVSRVLSLGDADTVCRDLYPNNHQSSLVLTHDVEEQAGFDFIPRVLELEANYNIKSSWNIVPYKYRIDKGIIRLITSGAHEIGIHGYNHDGKLYYTREIFEARAGLINKAMKEYGAVGFRSPMVHRNLRWLQLLDIEYDASCFDYDPFQPFPGGTASIWPFVAGRFVELPYTLPQDHVLWIQLQEKSNKIWEEKARWLHANHGVILLITHPDYLMLRDNLARYEDLLKFLLTLNNVWHVLPRELSRYWQQKFSRATPEGPGKGILIP